MKRLLAHCVLGLVVVATGMMHPSYGDGLVEYASNGENMRPVLRRLTESIHLLVAVDRSVPDTVPVTLNALSPREAFYALLRSAKLNCKVVADVAIITSPPHPSTSIRVHGGDHDAEPMPMVHILAKQVVGIVQTNWPSVTVTIDEQRNLIYFYQPMDIDAWQQIRTFISFADAWAGSHPAWLEGITSSSSSQ